MGTPVISFNFDKALKWPIRKDGNGQEIYHGYNRRPAHTLIAGVVLHSTNGPKGSTFIAEAEYLRDSPDVSAHYLIGKHGEITRLLDPIWRAWHAGVSAWNGVPDCNNWTVGVEFHHSADDPWYPAQLDAGAWLCRELLHNYPTITKAGICAHRWCALPLGRKSDPSNWQDADLKKWIAAL